MDIPSMLAEVGINTALTQLDHQELFLSAYYLLPSAYLLLLLLRMLMLLLLLIVPLLLVLLVLLVWQVVLVPLWKNSKRWVAGKRLGQGSV